ncbi:MAG: AraC family transcriptional regulator [Bermanella sp.]
MKLFIKNMVCARCTQAVEYELKKLNLVATKVSLGEVEFTNSVLTEEQLKDFCHNIEKLGFELINDKKARLIENTKKQLIKLIQHDHEHLAGDKIKLSEYLSEHLFKDYTHLSHLFSSVEGVTIEQYFINQKIEKTKELLVYDELTLTEISHRLGYSSVAHLSRQFKKVTGLTPSNFKLLRDPAARTPIDKV